MSSDKITQIKDFGDLKIYPYKDQDYEKLKNDCLAKGVLFEDPHFPAAEKSLYNSADNRLPFNVKWKRPSEIVDKPLFIDGALSADDLDQGQLGNCWFIAGCAAVSLVPELINKVVPPNQECSGKNYAGIFHFRFWLYGKWVDVVVDDRLPVNDSKKLVYCRSTESPNEFWAALLEKAYAKISFCYENLDGGFTTDAIIDMTGGIQESFKISSMQSQKQKDLLWDVLVKARQHNSLMGASINANPRIREARLTNGLVMGHAYTITKIALFERYGKDIRLIRCRNPWGNDVEWKGAWSDRSSEWNTVSGELRKILKVDNKPDGEFWISFDDFYRYFENVQLCSLTPDAYSDELGGKHPNLNLKWNMISYSGQWKPGVSAGGCGQPDKNSFWTNPQFLIKLTDVDPTDNENMATLIISLMQKYTREKRSETKGESAEQFVQFRLYRVKNAEDALKAKTSGIKLYAYQLEPAGTSGSYINLRDVTKRFRLPVGDYLIIPSCYEKNAEGDFLLRLFSEQDINTSNCKDLIDKKDKLTENDAKFFNVDKGKIFGNWNDMLNSTGYETKTEWKSSLTSRTIGSRSLRFPQLPYKDTNQSIYERIKIK